jgi:hypothetical protein
MWLSEVAIAAPAAGEPELAVNACPMRLDRARRDAQLGGDLVTGVAERDQSQNLDLARCQFTVASDGCGASSRGAARGLMYSSPRAAARTACGSSLSA